MNGLTLLKRGFKSPKPFWLLLSLLFFPALLTASQTPYVFPVEPTDISLQYLFFIFGPISTHSGIKNPNAVNVIIGYLTPLMVSAAVAAAALVTVRGVFVGSSSGHMIGERFSGLMTPLKILIGIGGLIPDGTGYSPIHKWLFWMVLNGIGLANQVWAVLINEYSMGYGWDQNVQISENSNIDWMTQQLLYVAMTKFYLEEKQSQTYVEVYPQSGSNYRMCDMNMVSRDPLSNCDATNQVVFFPVKDPGESQETSLDAIDFSALMESYLQRIMRDPLVQYGASQILRNENKISEDDILAFFGQEYCYSQIMDYQTQMQQYLQPFALQQDNDSLADDSMMQDGWMSAAFYYWKLWAGGGGSPQADRVIEDFTNPRASVNVSGSILNSNAYASLYASGGDSVSNKIVEYVDNLYAVKNLAPESNVGYEKIAGSAATSGLKDILKVSGTNFLIHAFIFTDANASSYREIYDLNYDFTKDRFASFINHNAKIIVHIINFLQSLIIILFTIVIVASIYNGLNPGLLIVLQLICTTLFLLTPLLVLIGTTSLMGSMYAAVIPGMIFGAGAFGWFIKIVEMIISAPLAAIAMIAPTEDETVAMTHVMMQLFMAITRPALMLIGFVLASKLCQISIMFAGGAFNYLGSTLSGIGDTGGMLFLVMMYEFMTMTTLAFCVRAFGFINLIPDTVFSVIRLQSQDNEADQLISVFERSGQQGAEQIGQVISMLNGLSKVMLSVVKQENK